MRAFFLVALTFAVAAAIGAARAGEADIMALRGFSGDGKPRVNAFQPPWRNLHSVAGGESAVGKRLDLDGSRQADATGYFVWKNNCVLLPPVVSVELREIRDQEGFGQVTPYIEKTGPGGEGFLEALVEQLSVNP